MIGKHLRGAVADKNLTDMEGMSTAQYVAGMGFSNVGYTIQPYSPAAGTGLSSHELNQPGCYRDVKDTTVVGQYKMKNPKPEMAEWGTPYFLAWTTTPWTLPSNTALCVGLVSPTFIFANLVG